jgi:hypothetical protein
MVRAISWLKGVAAELESAWCLCVGSRRFSLFDGVDDDRN